VLCNLQVAQAKYEKNILYLSVTNKKNRYTNEFNAQPPTVGTDRLLCHGVALCGAQHGVGADV
jgi:hypothetical protein